MKNLTGAGLIMLVMVIAAAGYATLLQLTGQPAAAEHFVSWAGGGLVVAAIRFVGRRRARGGGHLRDVFRSVRQMNSFQRLHWWVLLAGAVVVVVADVTDHADDNPVIWVLAALVIGMTFGDIDE